VTGAGTSYKIYYDIASWFVTQFSLCFFTAPFVILEFNASLKVWARVYFYGLVGVGFMTAFFASPARSYLKRQIDIRNSKAGVSAKGGARAHSKSKEELEREREPVLGLSADPEAEFDEVVREVRAEIEARQRKGLGRTETMPLPATKGL
jgi:lysophospholipid acyltransferase